MKTSGHSINSYKNKKSARYNPSILVIDDSIDVLELQKILLSTAGYEVFTAESVNEAVQVLSKIDMPNLILLDMQLDDETGMDFLDMLEKKRPDVIEHVPVVFLTAMDEVPESKAIGFIRKPADADIFLKAVSQYIEAGYHAPYNN